MGSIYIPKTGSGQPVRSEYQTINAACAAAVANDVIIIEAGNYQLTEVAAISVPGVKVVGIGDVIIRGAVAADYVFSILLGALAASAEIAFKNLDIVHDDDSTQQGIFIDNASAESVNAGKKVILNLIDVSFENDGGDSLHVHHTDTSNAVRVYISGTMNVIEGPINFTVKNDGDRLRLMSMIVRGGIVTSTDDKDAEIMLKNCFVKAAGVTGGHSNQRAFLLDCMSETDADPNVYALAATSDLAGSHTEVLLPAS